MPSAARTAREHPIRGVDVVIVVSGGRTATRLLGTRLSRVVPDAASVHEPDMINIRHPMQRTLPALRAFGLRHMVLDRLRGESGIRVIGESWLAGERSRAQTVQALRRQRSRYWPGLGKPLVVESYRQWYTVLELLPQVIDSYRVVGIVRDPRTWIRSWMRYGGQYDKRDAVALAGKDRLSPGRLGDADTASRWASMDSFERNAWYWALVYGRIATRADQDDRVAIFRFEDLLGPDREQTLARLLDFTCTWPQRAYPYTVDPSILDDRVNASKASDFPRWPDWEPRLAAAVDRHCGELMARFGYGDEPEWRALLDRA